MVTAILPAPIPPLRNALIEVSMSRTAFAVLSACLLVSSYATGAVRAAASSSPAHLVKVFVRLDGSPTAADPNLRIRDRFTHGHLRFDPTLAGSRSYTRRLDSYQDREIAFLRAQGIDLKVGYRYDLIFNGFAADVPSNEVARLRSLTNVSAVLPDRRVIPLDDRSVQLIHAPQAWTQLGGASGAGRGMYIADVDTGIDMTNPCFKDTGYAAPPIGHQGGNDANAKLTNNKVIRIRAYGPSATQQYSGNDVEGHGTFTAAIEACDNNTATPIGTQISGVAPDAYLMVYNIEPDRGDQPQQNLTQDPSLAAFQAALEDGADVINYSFGFVLGAGDEAFDAESQAINVISNAGLPVVVSAGNAGPSPISASSPSTAAGAISVGASTNDRAVSSLLHLSGAGVPSDFSQIPAVQGSVTFSHPVGPAPFVYVGLARKPGDSTDNPNANDFAGKDLHGKIALIDRGDIFFSTKINNAAAAGAVGAIVMDNVDETDLGMLTTGTTLPAMEVSHRDGQRLLALVGSNPDVAATLDPQLVQRSETPNVLADFSSRGYGPQYRIKPDLVAPGQDIYSAAESTVQSNVEYDPSGFTSGNGTSYSAPHVAGAIALLLQEHPTWRPSEVKAALMETSDMSAVNLASGANPTVMDVGAGLLDAQAALQARAYLSPSSISFGEVNIGYGAQTQGATLTLTAAGQASGTWSVSVDQLHGARGLAVTAPASVNLSGSSVSVPIHLSADNSTPAGPYDGDIVLKNGSQTLHVPYFVQISSTAVRDGSVLLVDDTVPRFVPSPGVAGPKADDTTAYYERALTAIGKTYTLWNERTDGSPSLADMKHASAVIYVTGNNREGFSHENSNSEAFMGPLTAVDLESLHAYMSSGGHIFISGLTAAISDPYFSALVLGTNFSSFSQYDNVASDPQQVGGVRPPTPSAQPDTRSGVPTNRLIFGNMKAIDLGTKGDGAGDNVGVSNTALPDIFGGKAKLVGVSAVAPYQEHDSFGNVSGQAALMTTDRAHGAFDAPDVAVVNSGDPTLKRTSTFPGRSVLFTFDFAGINDNTGYATRAQVMERIFQWFADQPRASVSSHTYRSRQTRPLQGKLAGQGVHPVKYQWQVGSKTLNATTKPTTYRFPRAGKFRLRVQITDSLGHTAISAWKTVQVK